MTTDELKNLQPAKIVDARGTACPGPLLEAKKHCTIKPGDIMEVISADEGTKVIYKMCPNRT
jgi:TusA-related sulfurtransferase